jgi:DNA polymerase (family 10)
MLTNKEIANSFSLLAQLMELHGEEDFKIRSYNNAYRILRNEERPLATMTLLELKGIKGVGDAIGNKILELQKNGKMRLLDEYLDKTPNGIVALLDLKGLGVKKIWNLWKDLEIESPGELLYACHENRLITLKGFGEKTQQNLKEQLEYYFQSQEKYRWASLESDADNLLSDLEDIATDGNVFLTGQFRSLLPVVDTLEFVLETESFDAASASGLLTELKEISENNWEGRTLAGKVKVQIYTAKADFSGLRLLQTTGPEAFVKQLLKAKPDSDFEGLSEVEIFEKMGHPFLPAEVRDVPNILEKTLPALIQHSDIKGILHVHSNYSDGASSLAEMANYVREQGYTYLGITDHSQSAFYANGLKPDRVLAQWKEIEELNASFNDFTIFKGIESDIRYDGELDYEPEILAGFDFVIASVHSHLKMNEEKATSRLIKAIENPYTTILGHPTGRLLLSRAGYPINHRAVIEACAKHGVAIEINANPHRLDLDYTWLSYALELGVKIAINPDAHSKQGVEDLRYGLQVARKGLLTSENCINCLSAESFKKYCQNT